MKLADIKKELKKMLLNFSVVKTDKGVLEYEGEELEVGAVLTIVDESDSEVKEPANGEYILEDGRTLVVVDGELKEIVEPKEEEPSEEEKPEEETVVEEEIKTEEEEPKVEEEVVEEEKTEEEIIEESPTETETKIAELEGKVAELEGKIEELKEIIENLPMGKPAAEEFENLKKVQKTGIAKVDKFLAGIKK